METEKQLRKRLQVFKNKSRLKWDEIADSSKINIWWLHSFNQDKKKSYQSSHLEKLYKFLNRKAK